MILKHFRKLFITAARAAAAVPFHDFSPARDEANFYFDTDHLHRRGLTRLLAAYIEPVLAAAAGGRLKK